MPIEEPRSSPALPAAAPPKPPEQLLDEALTARRLKVLGYADDDPPGQGTAETLNTIQVLLLKLVKHANGLLNNQNVLVMLLQETFIAAQESRDTTFDALVKDPWIAKGKTHETMQNFYDMKTRNARKKANELLEQFKKEAASMPAE